ncbi:VWA domain-containing protein [Acanthopleuribacter pedis]|uniref:VWA domain-containing protein n=1 Tax=Acanthopleuribacter pedis TaxID=442870 RepID=A0A8J7U3N0_9BACT|nr:VWA domain-containing protein [Acanthopleuribacter pedis]MBO1320598.1 VWA domain-containing protein [Acanthopleuribacter pedis]
MRVNLVELVVRAENLSGEKVRGLTAADFVVTEGGKRQKIDHIEEVDIHHPDGVHASDRSRLMILLDFKNTEYASMVGAFEFLRNFVEEFDFETSDLGLSFNLTGVQTVQPFTRNRAEFLAAVAKTEQFYNTKGHRSARTKNFTRRQLVADSDYFRQEIEVLGQFVNFLGAYNGRKNLLLVSNPWAFGRNDVQEGRRNIRGVVSLRDIQTTAQFNKVTLNILNLEPSPNDSEGRFARTSADVGIDESAELAAKTSGVYYRVNRGGLGTTMERVADDLSHFYRIRYYSNVKHQRYRRVNVKVKGLNRVGNHFAGFFPESELAPKKEVHGMLKGDTDAQVLAVQTDWMSWRRSGRKERGVNVVVSYRAFDELGQMIAERVQATELRVKKEKGKYAYPVLAQEVFFNWAEDQKPARFEARIVDMTSGERVLIQHQLAAN